MKTTILIISLILMSCSTNVYARNYCQNVNKTGDIVNDYQLANSMNKWLTKRGVSYRTSVKEIRNTIKNYCRSNPAAHSAEVTNHLGDIVDALAELGQ